MAGQGDFSLAVPSQLIFKKQNRTKQKKHTNKVKYKPQAVITLHILNWIKKQYYLLCYRMVMIAWCFGFKAQIKLYSLSDLTIEDP